MPETPDILLALAIALGLGLLVGMQRERSEKAIAGVRTFAIITPLGTVAGLLAMELGVWIAAAILLGVIIATAIGNVGRIQTDDTSDHDFGITTEMAILMMFAVGALLILGHRTVAVVIGGAIAILLHAKPQLHALVERMGAKDIRGVMQFALITLVILPVLPNEEYGPFDVLNPREIWLMVVLIVGISLGAYVAFKIFGERAGTILGGILGGMISSTATTVAFSRRAAGEKSLADAAAIVIMLASSVMYVRVLVEVSVVAPALLAQLAWPIGILLVSSLAVAFFMWLRAKRAMASFEEPDNPTELKSAIIFGALYAVVLFGVAAAEHYIGESGIYVVAALSGLTDMDAITLSSAQMAADERIGIDVAGRAIIIGALANLIFKMGIVIALSHPRIVAKLAPFLIMSFLVGGALIFFWPWGAMGE